ncbi:hypothetical protein JL722_12595 [Aureococcus anophagefferens]|nr:hypothetical protein JL722_12595 [Aureococcus anophagefferens]
MRRVLRLAVILSAAALSLPRVEGFARQAGPEFLHLAQGGGPAAAPPKTRASSAGKARARRGRRARRARRVGAVLSRGGAPSADEQLALRATLAALRHELDALRVAYRDLEGAHAATRRELARARANVTALAAEAAKAERLKRRMQIELRHVAARKAAPRAARNEPDAADACDPRGIDVSNSDDLLSEAAQLRAEISALEAGAATAAPPPVVAAVAASASEFAPAAATRDAFLATLGSLKADGKAPAWASRELVAAGAEVPTEARVRAATGIDGAKDLLAQEEVGNDELLQITAFVFVTSAILAVGSGADRRQPRRLSRISSPCCPSSF